MDTTAMMKPDVWLTTFNDVMIKRQGMESWQHIHIHTEQDNVPTEDDLETAVSEFYEFLSNEDTRVMAQSLLRATGRRLILAHRVIKGGEYNQLSMVCWDKNGLFRSDEPIYISQQETFHPSDWNETRYLDIRDVIDKIKRPQDLLGNIAYQLNTISVLES